MLSLRPFVALSICSVTVLALPLVSRATWPAFAAALQPENVPANLYPPAPLPGDLGIVTAAGKQEKPQIARGNDTFLAVWADTRSALIPNSTLSVGGAGPYQGRGLGTMNDIYAARIDADGNMIDQHPIVVSQASYNQNYPQVSWNGQNWLVVWYEELPDNSYEYRIRGIRVSPAGAVLDATPLTITTGSNNLSAFPVSLLHDGTNWVAFWETFQPGGSARSIYAARVAPDGTVRDPNGSAVYNHSSQFLADPDVAFNGNSFLAVFVDMTDHRIYGQRLSQALQPLGSRFAISPSSPTNPNNVQVGSNGDGFFVVWDDHPASGNIGALKGARVSATGQVLDPNSITIDSNVGVSESSPNVVWNGSAWWVGYESGYDQAAQVYTAGQDLYLKRVSAGGAILELAPVKVSAAPSHQITPALAAGASGAVQFLWHDFRTDGDVYAALVSDSRTVSPERAASLGAARQHETRMAFGIHVYLTVFTRQIAGNTQIYGQRLAPNANPVEAEPFLISSVTNPTNQNPAVAFNGTHFLVVWSRQEIDEFGNVLWKTYGRRISMAGVPLDAEPFYIMEGLTPDVAALGDTFLTVAIRRQGSQIRSVESVRVSSGGVVLGSPTVVMTAFNYAPRVAALGNRWLVVWEYHSRHDRSTSWTYAAFVEASGAVTEGSAVQVAVSDYPLSAGNSYDDTPHVAVSGDEALIVWADNDNNTNDIKGRRIHADGTLLGSNFGFIISNAPGMQLLPAVTWNGNEYVVTWVDHRDERFPTQPRGDIYAARVAPDDAVIDPAGFPIANSPAPEDSPFVTSANGSTIFAYSAFYDRAPFSAMRVTLRRSGTEPPQSTPTPTISPTPAPTATPSPTASPTPSPSPSATVTPTPTPSPTATPTAGAQPLNISTRLHVESGENVGIAGFIVTGTAPKRVAIRVLGPSLGADGITEARLIDPVVEIRAADGSFIHANDNWRDDPTALELEAVELAPEDDTEAALVLTLAPGAYTALASGKAGAGIGLVEVYDLTQGAESQLANISTRGQIFTGERVMIGGFILGGDTAASPVLVRGIGPSLRDAGVANPLPNPTLELYDSHGTLIRSNDDWQQDQRTEIESTTIPPRHEQESAIWTQLAPGAYTAVLADTAGATGVGLVEIYTLR